MSEGRHANTGSDDVSTNSSTQAPRKGLNSSALIGLIAGGVALLGFAAIVVGVLVDHRDAKPRGAAAAEAAEVVEGYLHALADGDADRALSFLDSDDRDRTLLTDAVLAASNDLAPLEDIHVIALTQADDSARVEATYTIGLREVSTVILVTDDAGDGTWKIVGGTTELMLDRPVTAVDATLNGQPIHGDTVTVFPGTYELATTTQHFEILGSTIIVVEAAGYNQTVTDVTIALTREGVDVFREAVRASAAACLAEKTIESTCGLDAPAVASTGEKLVEGTVTRTLDEEGQETLDGLLPAEYVEDSLAVRSPSIGGVDLTAQCVAEGPPQTCSILGPWLEGPTVDFSTDPVTVEW